MDVKLLLILCLVCGFFFPIQSYKPVFMLHGLSSDQHNYDDMIQWIEAAHPGTWTEAIAMYNKLNSTTDLWTQVKGISSHIRDVVNSSPDIFSEGYHLVCHSQGALTCRAIAEYMSDHKISGLLLLSGPLLGEYGPYSIIPEEVISDLYKLLYTPKFQAHFSPANMWNDPHQQDLFLSENVFLPPLSNLLSDSANPAYKTNFIKVEQLVCFGSPADESILPWQSAKFEFYDESENIIPLDQTRIYNEDLFGLKTLMDSNKVDFVFPDNVTHMQWVQDEDIFDKYILPYLI